MSSDLPNAGIERPRSIWGDNPRTRNVILIAVAVLIVARVVTTVSLAEEHWREAARWIGFAVVPKPDPSLANARIKGSVADFFDDSTYPDDARDRGESGRVRSMLQIGPNGRAVACRVVQSSGSRSLDHQTCAIALARIRFEPARDAAGRATSSSYPLNIRWNLVD